MHIGEHVTALRREGVRFAQAAESAGMEAGVPTCPGWQVRDLVGHLGAVHRWAGSYVLTGNPEPTSGADEMALVPPGDSELMQWFRAGHAALVDALGAADPAMTCWAFLPAPSPLAFWARRQAHETAIHRFDAQCAAGAVEGFPVDLASDGIDELLCGFFRRDRGRLVADPPVTVGLQTTDSGAAWTIRIEPDRRVVQPGLAEGDCIVTGPASNLYLLLWNRADSTGLDVTGDAAALDLWRAKAQIKWR